MEIENRATQAKGKPNVSDMVYERLRNSIYSGEWKPGERIPSESKICEMMSVSRVSARAAISRMMGQGLVERRQGGGTYIRTCSCPDQFEPMIPYMLSGRADRVSMFEFRKIIEVESIGLAAMRADIGQIDQMQAAYEAMAMAKSDELISRYDMQFHHLIAVATNNPVILRVFEIIQDTYLRPMLDQNVAVMGAYGAVYHEKMIRAVERRDVAQAKRLMEEHINNTIQMTAQLNR